MPVPTPRFGTIRKWFAPVIGVALLGQVALAQSTPPQSIGVNVARTQGRPLLDQEVTQTAQAPQSTYTTGYGGEFGASEQSPDGSGTYFPPAAPGTPLSNQPGAGATPATNPFAAPTYNGGFGGLLSEAGGAGGGGTTAVADNPVYIDSAIVRTRFRMRYSSAYDLNSPDKAEFFYAKCGCFGNPTNFLLPGQVFKPKHAFANGYDPKSRGPQHGVVPGRLSNFSSNFKGENHINYQELNSYFEYASTRRFSTFIEVPVRFIDPSMVKNFYGFSDINAGFKYALVAEPNRYYTFQLRGYVPTGAADKGLGTGHPTLEPSLLVFQRLTERLYFSGEIRDWIPIQGSDFSGNIIRYGAGLAYNIVLTNHFRIAPVNEIVGWSILGGKETTPSTPSNQANVGGQAIVNELVGLRFGVGDYSAPGGGSALNDRHSFGLSYGRCITGDHWYKDVVLAEYNFWF